MKKAYAIGVDFGTESGRAVLIDLADGAEIATHITKYPHGVIEEELPGSGIRIGDLWALQDPMDYLEVLYQSVPFVLQQSGVSPSEVIGIGIDFTACTMLPVDKKGLPLCIQPELRDHPHSWVKLWKHHAAQEEADRLNQVAATTQQEFLKRYGGKISSEWMIPKICQILNEDPEIYDQTDLFLEAGDWVTFMMTGNIVRNSCAAGYKSLWHKELGYPDRSYLRLIDTRLEDLFDTKLRGSIGIIGSQAGKLQAELAHKMGLDPGIAVAVANVDAHSAVPGSGVVTTGKLVMAMGTSTCHLLLGSKEVHAEGIGGVVIDGIIPGYYGYEAGQPAVGDTFAWFVEQGVPSYVNEAASAKGLTVHQWLEEQAARYSPGETGLLCLDWWNGNRSVLADSDLSGMIIGYTLQTKPEEIYRSLLEATAFGTRKIIETFEENGLAVEELYACGGLPQKNKLLMQIYADVTGKEIKIAASTQTPALGAAMFGAVAAGSEGGGYDSIVEAAEKMAHIQDLTIKPIPQHVAIYEALYNEYCTLHDYFGRGGNPVLKKLLEISGSISGSNRTFQS